MDKDTHKEAKEAFKTAADAESEQRIVSLEDLKFCKLGEQWHDADRKARESAGRPCMTFNRIPAFLRQVTNDARQNRPAIKCHPVGSGADKDTAQIYDGLIRNIEYTSNADVAYDTALDFSATMGYGYWIVRTDYANDDAWELDLMIERVANPFSVYSDPYSTSADSADWNDAFVTSMMRKGAFMARWPDADDSDFKGDGFASKETPWFQGEELMVAEYWQRREAKAKLLRLSNDAIMFEEEYLRNQELFERQGIVVAGDRLTKTHKVVQHILNGSEVLETNEWRGKFIPIVPVYGDEVNIEGKRYFKSLFRDAKDSQRMFNYWRTASIELVALAPKAPYIGPVGMFATDHAKWQTINKENYGYAEYDVVPEQPGATPQRQAFAGPPAGALQESLNAADDMKAIIGIYDASLGARSNETSGKAILVRQREGDVSTFHLVDNLSRAIRHTGRILVDLIPKHYNTERIIRCIKEDGSNFPVPVNQPAIAQPQLQALQAGQQIPQAQPNAPMVPLPHEYREPADPEMQKLIRGITKMYDLTAGKYDVTVDAGPSFSTRREETAAQMMEFIRVFPQAAPLIGDLLAKHLDWAGAEDIAERLKAMLPPQLQGQAHPMVQQLQQLLQRQDAMAKQAVGQLQAEVQRLKQAEANKQGELALKAEELKLKAFEAETHRIVATKPDAGPQEPVVDPLEVERVRIQQKEVEIKAFDAETKRIDVAAKALETETNARAQQVQQVDIPQATIAQNGEQVAATLAALNAVAQAVAAKPKRKRGNVIRDPATNQVIGMEMIEEPFEVQQGVGE